SQLALMNQQASLSLARADRFHNLIKRHDVVLEITQVEAERQKRAGHRTRDRDALPSQPLVANLLTRDDHWAIVVAHTRAVGQYGVLVGDIGVGMDRNGGDFQTPFERPLIQRLDITQDMLEPQTFSIDMALRQTIEHERIIRVRAVAQTNRCALGCAVVRRAHTYPFFSRLSCENPTRDDLDETIPALS